MDDQELTRLMRHQSGVISRRQVLACGGDDNLVERRVRRREWARVHEGVYVDHTGPVSWDQRAWAAVLLHAPAALTGEAALRSHGLSTAEPLVVEVAVDFHRRVADPPGVRTRRVRYFAQMAQLHLGPPRLRVEDALLAVASRARSEDAAVARLADGCQSGHSTAERLVDAFSRHPRLPRRSLLLTIVADVATGAYSALERRYLVRVERPHGLPTAVRQRRVRPGRTAAYRDVDYLEFATVVELDGRLGHERAGDRWADLERDVASVAAGDLTVRVGWRQVLDPCRLAGLIGRLLRARGWTGTVRSCGTGCALDDGGDVPAPGAGDAPRSAA